MLECTVAKECALLFAQLELEDIVHEFESSKQLMCPPASICSLFEGSSEKGASTKPLNCFFYTLPAFTFSTFPLSRLVLLSSPAAIHLFTSCLLASLQQFPFLCWFWCVRLKWVLPASSQPRGELSRLHGVGFT